MMNNVLEIALRTNFVFNSRIFSFRVFANKNGIDVVIGSFEAFDGHTRADVGEEIKSTTQSQIKRDVSLANLGWTV